MVLRQTEHGIVDRRLVLPAEDLGPRVLERPQAHYVRIDPQPAVLGKQAITEPVGEHGKRAGRAMHEQLRARQHCGRIAKRDAGRNALRFLIHVQMHGVTVCNERAHAQPLDPRQRRTVPEHVHARQCALLHRRATGC